MTLAPPRSRSAASATFVALGCVVALASQTADEVFFALTKKVELQLYRLPQGKGSLDVPKRDWQVRPGQGEVLVSVVQRRNEASAQVEVATLNQPLEAADVTDLFAELERDRLQAADPQARDFDLRLFRVGDRRVAVVQFTRTGARGQERVRQYSYPQGRELFRLVCVAPVNRFAAYEAVFAHMAASFAPTGTT